MLERPALENILFTNIVDLESARFAVLRGEDHKELVLEFDSAYKSGGLMSSKGEGGFKPGV